MSGFVEGLREVYFEDDGVIPNSGLPVLMYRGVLKDRLGDVEAVFNGNRWLNSWVNGVFGYHHYHSNSHEVLGVVSGEVTVQLGGEQGQAFTLVAGDVVVLPAGTGHKRLEASEDFRIVGAYPGGISYNTRTGEPGEYEQALGEIPQVPLPDTDPVFGVDGPLVRLWRGEN
ncbi:cupin domain-containing protein [Paenibacillus sp. WLX1005]|uniref:cupin domain-containing protein n=1 Tax=Paenibacillus sp. WLX1005 TaxID=3243766 RepID=UPI003984059C